MISKRELNFDSVMGLELNHQLESGLIDNSGLSGDKLMRSLLVGS